MTDTLHSYVDPDRGAVVLPESPLGSGYDLSSETTPCRPAGELPISIKEDVEETIWVFGVPLAPVTYEQALHRVDALIQCGRPAFFITANLHYAALCDEDPRLDEVNRKAAFLVADGMPMVWYSRLTGRPLPERVTGADLVGLLCARAAERGYRVYLLGGSVGVADLAAEKLRHRYPGLQIAGTAAPQLNSLSPQENCDLVASIHAAHPQLLLVAFGQPKGELWLAENLESLGVPACVQLGASFDFVAGRIRRAPMWMRHIGFEWLYRIGCEPRRLFPRYFADARFLFRAVWRDMLASWLQRR